MAYDELLVDQYLTSQWGPRDDRFPDPFADMATLAMPRTIQDCNRYAEYIINANGVYREALKRIVAYFVTEIQILAPNGEDSLGEDEKRKYEDFFNDTLGIKSVLYDVALDYLTYGNSFSTFIVPFRRYLSCQGEGCGFEAPLKKIYNNPEYKFSWSNFEFRATCPKCGYEGKFLHTDRRSRNPQDMRIKLWSCHEIDINWELIREDRAYIWKIPEEYRNQIRKGHLFHLDRVPMEVVQAVKKNQNLMFDDGTVFHLHEHSSCGIRSRGWGISRVIQNFRQAWYYQLLIRFNEAIALERIAPLNILTPGARQGGAETADPLLSINMGGFVARIQNIIKRHRKDPGQWAILPYPVEAQIVGGDASQLAPKDLIELATDTLLTSVGIPVEFFKGNISAQGAPALLRLFESNWSHLVHQLDRFLQHIAERASEVLDWPACNVKLVPPTTADALEKTMMLAQLMMGGQVSQTTGLKRTVDLNFKEEKEQMLLEEKLTADLQSKIEKQLESEKTMDDMAAPLDAQQDPGATGAGMNQAAQQAGAAPQGAPAQGGQPTMGAYPPNAPMSAVSNFMNGQSILPNAPTTIDEIHTLAESLASQAMTMPDSARKQFMNKIKKENPTVGALVVSLVGEQRRAAQQQGGDMIMQQQQQQAQQTGTQKSALAVEYSWLTNSRSILD